MSEAPRRLDFLNGEERGKAGGSKGPRIGVTEDVVGGPDRLASLAALFPHATFESAGGRWLDAASGRYDVLIAGVAASSAAHVEQAVAKLKALPAGERVIVVLVDADVVTSRRLLREGAADVLPAPAGEPALAVAIERLLAANPALKHEEARPGQAIALLKAGGGVGATSLGVQLAALAAARAPNRVCFADLDLQFGCGSLYLDLPEALSLADVLGAGTTLQDTPFGTALATHRSGVKVLAAPRDITPLEALSPQIADILIAGLKRDFALTIIDLPSVWTAWTNRALQLADRVVIVTQLSVPHMQQLKRQMRIITSQGLDEHPMTLVINGVSSEQQSQVSLKSAERAIGRKFDVVIPEDRRTMNAAINQGLTISAVRRGTKLEKAIAELCDRVAADALTEARAIR